MGTSQTPGLSSGENHSKTPRLKRNCVSRAKLGVCSWRAEGLSAQIRPHFVLRGAHNGFSVTFGRCEVISRGMFRPTVRRGRPLLCEDAARTECDPAVRQDWPAHHPDAKRRRDPTHATWWRALLCESRPSMRPTCAKADTAIVSTHGPPKSTDPRRCSMPEASPSIALPSVCPSRPTFYRAASATIGSLWSGPRMLANPASLVEEGAIAGDGGGSPSRHVLSHADCGRPVPRHGARPGRHGPR
jgi:hypothetical protein